jgi:hypothetical protein
LAAPAFSRGYSGYSGYSGYTVELILRPDGNLQVINIPPSEF